MLAFTVRRLLNMSITVVLASLVAFALMRVVPNDPAEVILTRGVDSHVKQEEIDAVRKQMGLNDPVLVQYVKWMAGLTHLDAGDSLITQRPVLPQVMKALATSAELAVLTIILALAVAIPAGVLSAIHRGSLIDHGVRVSLSLWDSIPTFWLGSVLLIVFSRVLGWLPPLRFENLWENPGSNLLQLVWPALIVALHAAAGLGRMARSSMLEVLHQDYVRTARAKGLASRVIYMRHAFRNAALPVVALSGLTVVNLVGGLVVAETIFNVPGIGTTFIRALHNRDYPMIQMILLVLTINVVVIMTLLDIVYGMINPAIRSEG